jgi:hypothetical protein
MIDELMKNPFEKVEVQKRKEELSEYNNDYNAGKIISLLQHE